MSEYRVSKTIRSRISCLSAALLLAASVSFASCAAQTESALRLHTADGTSPLMALNRNARTARVQSVKDGGEYLYFSFSQEQLHTMTRQCAQQPQSLYIELHADTGELLPGAVPQVSLGLLYPDDFTENGRLRPALAERPLVQAALRPSERQPLGCASAFAVKGGGKLPAGFFIYTTAALELAHAEIIPAALGWDLSQQTPRFYFGQSGGFIPADTQVLTAAFDFSDAAELFASPHDTAYHMGFEPLQSMGTQSTQPRVSVSMGEEELSIRRTIGTDTALIPAAAFAEPYGVMHTAQEHDGMRPTAVLLQQQQKSGSSADILQPIAADPGLVITWDQSRWRTSGYELFAWDRFPSILFFDFGSYDIQDRFLKRLAFFTEKQGFKGRLAADSEIAGLHGYNAHDYRSQSLADFYTLASQTRFPLNEEEQLLCRILVHNNIISAAAQPDGTTVYTPQNGAIISISQESPEYLRYTFTAHEGLHGLYFIDEEFRRAVHQIYTTSDARSIAFLEQYFVTQPTLMYDINDQYLMENEFMAYMLQRPVSQIRQYFAGNLAAWKSVNAAIPELARYVRETDAQGFEQAAIRLSQYVFERWGLSAGRTWLIAK